MSAPAPGPAAAAPPSLARVALLLFGVVSCATAVIIVKLSHEHAMLLSAYRTLGAALLLAPLCLRECRREGVRLFSRSILLPTVLPGLFLGAHFVSWIIGARLTPAANSSLIVNMVPVVMPLLLFALFRELFTRAEAAGTLLAIAGLAVLGWSDFRLSRESFGGDAICLLSMAFLALYLALGRRSRGTRSIWVYVVPLYAVAGLSSLLLSLFFVNPFHAYPLREAGLIAALVLIPTVSGHSILNSSMRHMRGQTVALVNLSQVGFAALMAWPVLGESPATLFYPALGLIAAGAVVVIRSERSASSAP